MQCTRKTLVSCPASVAAQKAASTAPNTTTKGSDFVCPSRSRAGMKGFSDMAYNTAADDFLETVLTAVEDADSDRVTDTSLSSGVLTVETKQGVFLINKQAPHLQLWLSSPMSGPSHYDMDKDEKSNAVRWVCLKTSKDLVSVLEKELSASLGQPIRLRK